MLSKHAATRYTEHCKISHRASPLRLDTNKQSRQSVELKFQYMVENKCKKSRLGTEHTGFHIVLPRRIAKAWTLIRNSILRVAQESAKSFNKK